MWSALDWIIDRDARKINIDPKYADDITFIRSDRSKINQIERMMPEMLLEQGLFINKSKTEEYHISRTSDTKWRSCKYLGSLLGTEEDIKRRKGLVCETYNTLETILGNNQVSEAVRLRIFKVYIESIFLYNSELWTLTKTLENTIDSFQRRILRKVIHVKWPRTINNQELYERTHMTPWSITISKRRLSWFGHLLRLPTETPEKEAVQIYIKAAKRPTGRPKTAWLSIVLNDINNHSETKLTGDLNQVIDRLELICSDRMAWTKIIDCTMAAKQTNVH